MKNKIIYVSSIVAAFLFLALGFLIVRGGYDFQYADQSEYMTAKVVGNVTETVKFPNPENKNYTVTTYSFQAKVKSGSLKGETLNATQKIDSASPQNPNPVKSGDSIIIYNSNYGINGSAPENTVEAEVISDPVKEETDTYVSYTFDAKISDGPLSGRVVSAVQTIFDPVNNSTSAVVRGDKAYIGKTYPSTLQITADKLLAATVSQISREDAGTYSVYKITARIEEGEKAGADVTISATRANDFNPPSQGDVIFVYSSGSAYSFIDEAYYLSSIKYDHDTAEVLSVEVVTDNETETVCRFSAEMIEGENPGKNVTLEQTIKKNTGMYGESDERQVSVGDRVYVRSSAGGAPEFESIQDWVFADHHRSTAAIILAILFGVALILFGRMKGLKTLVTLVLTIASVFMVLMPSILGGRNIYFWTVVVCLYITSMTLIIVNGISFMSLVGGIGCMGGVLIAAIITLIMDRILNLTGYTDECSIYIKGINNGTIDLKALVFAGILIGSLGAVMDVAVNISAAVHEVATKIGKPSFKELFKSGITISRDIIGTMSNTLILAYIGSSVCSVLLVIYNNSFSMINLFNKENIIVELLKILVGSFGILSALPLTSAVAALFYSSFEKFDKGRTAEK